MDNSDLSDIKSTIGHHDARIEDLGRRIGGVEHVVRSLSGEVSKGFSDLAAKLNGLESSRGPGFGRVAGVTATVFTCVAFLCAGLFWVVVTTMAPDVAKVAKLDAERDMEFRQLRDEKDARIEHRLKSLEAAFGWLPKEIVRVK